jgi:hypothetical protein
MTGLSTAGSSRWLKPESQVGCPNDVCITWCCQRYFELVQFKGLFHLNKSKQLETSFPLLLIYSYFKFAEAGCLRTQVSYIDLSMILIWGLELRYIRVFSWRRNERLILKDVSASAEGETRRFLKL